MNFDNGKFTYARYISSKKDIISALWYYDVEGSDPVYEEIIIETDLENKYYVKLLETFTTDEISTMTDQFVKEEEENFKLYVKKIAEDYGMIYDPNAANRETVHSVDHIFNPPEGDEGTDLLFQIKLNIFELDEVTSSDNDELKKQLREATTPLQAFYVAGKFLFE